MKIKNIKIEDLDVNKQNDRHGELGGEAKAIEWLLHHRADHMRNLTKDIVNSGQIYETPLVHLEDSRFVVHDGNRRVTCLKLLNNPTLAPDKKWREFFKEQIDIWSEKWKGKPPIQISCQVEADRDRIDEILYRRHTGGQSGVGQSPWDPAAKSNFVARTGKKTKVNLAEEIEKKLKETGHIEEGKNVPRSNLNRLLSSESLRNRIGLSIQKNHVEITHDEGAVFEALERIVSDLMSKTVTLDDIWSNQDKLEYLDDLAKEGVLPESKQELSEPKNFKTLKSTKSKSQKATTKKSKKSPVRKTLIRPDIDYEVQAKKHTQRLHDIWIELTDDLRFGKHDNAIAVLFRVLIEFCIENYIARNKLSTVHQNDTLGKKFKKVTDHMLAEGHIDKKYAEVLGKFPNVEPLLSANTMNQYVHHQKFFPSDSHLKSMWDTLSEFLVICVNA